MLCCVAQKVNFIFNMNLFLIVDHLIEGSDFFAVVSHGEIYAVSELIPWDRVWILESRHLINSLFHVSIEICVFPSFRITSVFQVIQILENRPFNYFLRLCFRSDKALGHHLEQIFPFVI